MRICNVLCLRAILLVLALAVPAQARADSANLRLPRIYGDHMVLQRQRPISIWGWAAPGKSVTLSLAGKHVSVTAGKDGKWLATLPSMDAGGPYQISVKSEGEKEVVLSDIMIGEVWMCSGQSNMSMPVGGKKPFFRTKNYKEEIANANYPLIRLHKVVRGKSPDKPLDDVAYGHWQVCSPESVEKFSAAGYFFGRQLYKDLNVPIGLVCSAWGGTPIQSWISRDGYASAKRGELKKIDEVVNNPKLRNKGAAKGQGFPSTLYNAMINPWTAFPMRGAIWYQGESNTGRKSYKDYMNLQPLLIRDWRRHWKDDDFAFIITQLAAFQVWKPDKRLPDNFRDNAKPEDDTWSKLREIQMATLQMPKTGMAITIDVGDHSDIHPRDKQTVGFRLAKEAERVCYGEKGVTSGPLYAGLKVVNGKILISFTNVGAGLEARGGELREFAIAGGKSHFVWAEAAIKGDKVVVWSDEVKDPKAVRYAWSKYPGKANLYNKEGFAASPFRTDTPDYLLKAK